MNTYFEGQFPVAMWNHFDNHDERTNNRVEGDNNKMKLFRGASDPKIDKATKLLQQYETTAKDKYNNAKKENAKAPAQKADVALREANFRQIRRLYRDGKVSYKDYFESILEIQKFEPKKKYIEDLEDTSESDTTSISEYFLLRIEDTGIRTITQRMNSTLEEDTVYHRLEPRRTSLEVPSNPQFFDSVSTSTEHGELVCQSSQSTKEQEICDLYSRTYTKRGITKNRNSCVHLNKLLFNYFFLLFILDMV